MSRLQSSLPLPLLLAVLGGRRAEGPAPRPSAEAPEASPPPPPPAAPSAEPDDPPPPPMTGPPVVDLHGKASPPPPIPEGAPRLAGIAMLTEVHARPDP